MSEAKRSVNYHDYLQLDRILGSQEPPDPASSDLSDTRDLIHHDELLFVVMHQTMELWFKMVIADLEAVRDLVDRDQVPERDVPIAVDHLRRTARTFEHLTSQFTLIETMSPLNFLTFRDALIPASGFQSWQFRRLENLAGLKDEDRLKFEGQPYYAKMSEERQAEIAEAEGESTLRDAIFRWLARTPFDEAFPDFVAHFRKAYFGYLDDQSAHQERNPNLAAPQKEAIRLRFEDAKKQLDDFVATGDDEINRAHAAFLFIASYRQQPLLTWPWSLLDRILEFEEHFRIFRFRHARMVERMIGLRVGSGGSAGVAYLDATASRYRIFGELLKGTSFLIERSRLPDIPQPGCLGFHRGR